MNMIFENILLSFPSSQSRKSIVIWISNNVVFNTIFLINTIISHKVYTKLVSFQKSGTHISLFFLGGSHLQMFYKIRLLNSLAKSSEKLLKVVFIF